LVEVARCRKIIAVTNTAIKIKSFLSSM